MCANGGATVTDSEPVAKDNEPCEFPFEYDGVIYKECTPVVNNDVPWCYVNSTVANAWGDCKRCGSICFPRYWLIP